MGRIFFMFIMALVTLGASFQYVTLMAFVIWQSSFPGANVGVLEKLAYLNLLLGLISFVLAVLFFCKGVGAIHKKYKKGQD